MAKKKTSETVAELHRLTPEQLSAELEDARKRLFTLRTQAATEKIEDPNQFRRTRRTIARLLTERNARRAKAGA